MLPHRKPSTPTLPIAVGYINRHRIPDGLTLEALNWPLRSFASELGYAWGGTYLAQSADEETVAALTRRVGADSGVALVVVPDASHFPADQCVVLAGERCVQVVIVCQGAAADQ
ncbi:hypothetical protein ACFXHA_45415 [Nocardia sp. NPDC059240]|uniref:hypothetical protein n=1 Tax=Nocardia sp. NPDC059240 TaxID=3346786 RepID=UPI0036C36A69